MTYSIVARDPVSGELGVAVQSHWFSVGALCPWAEAGVGAVATQASVEVSYGPLALELLRAGRTAAEALTALTTVDAEEDRRQVAVVDAQGGVAVHTGRRCIPEAGHRTGDGVTVQANMMRNATVPDAMLAAYDGAAHVPLPERLLLALEAAEGEGGDVRGRQSAALVVVRGTSSGRPWEDRTVDLRVEDHAEPLGELGRLLSLERAYTRMQRADDALVRGDTAAASDGYLAARSAGLTEAAFWHAVVLAEAGDVEGARGALAEATAEHDGWAVLLSRLPAVGLLSEDAAAALLPPRA